MEIRPDDPWGHPVPLRDVAAIDVQLVGAVVAQPELTPAFVLSFPDDLRAERATNAYGRWPR